MIEPADEMREVFLAAEAAFRKAEFVRLGFRLHVPTLNRQAFAAGLAAVLALAERQWQEQYGDAFQAGWWRGQHKLCPRCGVELEREVRES